MVTFTGFRASWLFQLYNIERDFEHKILHKHISPNGFAIKGTPVFAYQKVLDKAVYDEITHNNAIAKTHKVHLTYCKKIQESPGKYHVTSRADGFFNVNIRSSNKVIGSDDILLPMGACQYCIRELFPDFLPPVGQDAIKSTELANSFNFSDFVVEGRLLSNIAFNEYGALNRFVGERDWYQFSRDLRAKNNWTCEECGINLFKYRQFLHVHHINHSHYWNTPANCRVLCISCHAEQPNHAHMKDQKCYNQFIAQFKNK
ncbi:HNH endonuclease [Pseudoalteromonas sp. '520P1 No. 412']|uniref:HNH endonuclease n=1 Tax=Pseudoalteromonas sp. '520P1 No. 412' TaxID=304208 RepID=UPI0005AA1272|nr:HNH endonuclease signature motif containing protein [Pseudoalteromonas sp. '520P1 No. 412']